MAAAKTGFVAYINFKQSNEDELRIANFNVAFFGIYLGLLGLEYQLHLIDKLYFSFGIDCGIVLSSFYPTLWKSYNNNNSRYDKLYYKGSILNTYPNILFEACLKYKFSDYFISVLAAGLSAVGWFIDFGIEF